MNELILKITNIAISYPNQLSKFFAVSKVNDKIDWKLFVQSIEEYLELNKHSSSPITSVFEKVLYEVNNHFCKVICVWDYDGVTVKNIKDSCLKQKIPIEEIIEEVREPSKANKFWKWLVDLIG